MTDELLYERFAISIAQTHSLLPRLRQELVPSLAQVYPVLIAPLFRHGSVPDNFHAAHLFNAWLMSSACIPAFLLTRRVTSRLWAAWFVAVLSVCMPWILYSSFLLTEVVGYPAFLWVALAAQRTIVAPSARNDLTALLALIVGFFARTQFIVLVVVVPIAIAAYDAPRVRRAGLAAAVRARSVLIGAYGLLLAGAVALLAIGKLSQVGGVYRSFLLGDLLPHGLGSSFVEHLAMLSLGLGILPFLVGAAWLLANLVRPAADSERHAFACFGAVAVAAVTLETAIYDLKLGAELVFDRYLFYLAPVLVLAAVCAVCDRAPRWSLVPVTGLVALGFALHAPPAFTWFQFQQLDSDTPLASLYRPLVHLTGSLTAARASLAAATVLLATLGALGAWRRRRLFAAVLLVVLAVALPAETAYLYTRLFGVKSWSDRALTQPQGGAYDWIDATLGGGSRVTMVPYPVSSDFAVSQQHWLDIEFWNKSVVRDAHYQGPRVFAYVGTTFPKLALDFAKSTGAVDIAPTQWVAQSDKETRFRITGTVRAVNQDVMLIDAGRTWRLDWLTYGLYDDGWTKPGVTAHMRIFPSLGQRVPTIRFVTFAVRPPEHVPPRSLEVSSNVDRWQGTVTLARTVIETIRVCVPAQGYAEVSFRTPTSSEIPGDLKDPASSTVPRRGGVFFGALSIADELGGPCQSR
jgi:hypothetical protein